MLDETSFNSSNKYYLQQNISNNIKILNENENLFNDEAPSIPLHLLKIYHINVKYNIYILSF